MRLSLLGNKGRPRTPWLILLIAAAAGVWLLAQHLKVTIVVRALASTGTIVIPIMANLLISGIFTKDDALTKVFLQHLRGYSRRRGIPTVRGIRDITSLGVTASRDAGGDVPGQYMPRGKDKDPELLLDNNTFVLIIGDSKAGKSRMGAEAMRRKFGGRNLIIPDTADSLPALLEAEFDFANCVVWLDDLQRYLEKNGIQRLLDFLARADAPRDATVLATIREKVYATFMPNGETESPYWPVLQRAARLRIERLLTVDERKRAATIFTDPDLLKALDRYGLAEYLSAGPDLVDRLDSAVVAQPVGAMVVLAAADWSRTGLTQPVPQQVLMTIAESYLDRIPVQKPGPSDINKALEWAQQPLYGVSQLLIQAPGGYTVFDYVLDHLAPTAAIPDEVWKAAISVARGDELVQVGLAAFEQNRLDIAIQVFEVAVQPGTPIVDATIAAFNYARILEHLDRIAEAEEYYLKAEQGGHVEAAYAVGRILEARGETDLARTHYETAADGGHPAAAYSLGMLLREADPDQALTWLGKAANVGHIEAAYAAGRIHEARGDNDNAQKFYRLAAQGRPGGKQLAVPDPRAHIVARSAGSGSRALFAIAERANLLEAQFATYSDGELRQRSGSLTRRLKHGESPDDLIPEAFAVLREAASRVIGFRYDDEHLISAAALHRGYIAHMHRGRGSFETSMLAAYPNALSGNGVHIIVPDDRTALREAQRLGSTYNFLGLTINAIVNDMTNEARRAGYAADVTYADPGNLICDYLRDNMAWSEDQRTQRRHDFAVVHEADLTMINEAFEGASISTTGETPSRWFNEFAKLARQLRQGTDYEVDTQASRVVLTEAGIAAVEDWLGIEDLYTSSNVVLVPFIDSVLQAKELHRRDEDYVVFNKEILYRDRRSGVVSRDRPYPSGVQQAIQAMEGVPVQAVTNILATMHRWSYLTLYAKLSGITCAASDSANAFQQLYARPIYEIPSSRPRNFKARNDLIFYNDDARWRQVAQFAADEHATGRPVIVDTSSDERTERVSSILAKLGIPHDTLTTHHLGAKIDPLANVGRKGAITVGTNLYLIPANIKLGGANGTPQDHEDLVALGGLLMIGSERRLARRDDDRLSELTAQDGDPGEAVFMIGKTDALVQGMLKPWVEGIVGDLPVANLVTTRAMRSWQRTMAAYYDERRERDAEYHMIFEDQRAAIYELRKEVLTTAKIDDIAREYLHNTVDSLVASHSTGGQWKAMDTNALDKEIREIFAVEDDRISIEASAKDRGRPGKRPGSKTISSTAHEMAQRAWDTRVEKFGMEVWIEVERRALLSIIDRCWREYLAELHDIQAESDMAVIKSGDPRIEYKNAADEAYRDLKKQIKIDFVKIMMTIEIEVSYPSTSSDQDSDPSSARETTTDVKAAVDGVPSAVEASLDADE